MNGHMLGCVARQQEKYDLEHVIATLDSQFEC